MTSSEHVEVTNNNPAEPSVAKQAISSGQASPPGSLTPEQLEDVFLKHKMWLETQQREGQQADLSSRDLSGVDFSGKDLRQAVLAGANFRGVKAENCDFSGAVFHFRSETSPITSFAKANLIGATFAGAILYGLDFEGANLSKANLNESDLHSASLSNANLREARLEEANLTGADLQNADLSGASLRSATFANADLFGAKLDNSDLQDTDLQSTKGLFSEQLAGANITNIVLPESISDFKELKIVEEVSKMTQTHFITVLLGCVYSWLTIGMTLESRLVTNSTTSPLPIINTTIPIVYFYVVAPVLLLVLYIHFHLYLQRLWEGLSDLPAFFSDGRPLDKMAYPWLMNSLVRRHKKLLSNIARPLSGLQAWLSILLAWVMVPVTLLIFWLKFLSAHRFDQSLLQLVTVSVSVGFGLRFYLLARDTLNREPWGVGFLRNPKVQSALATLVTAFVLSLFTYGAINGVRYGPFTTFDQFLPIVEIADAPMPETDANFLQLWVPHFLDYLSYSPAADMAGEDVSTKPDNWNGQLDSIKGAKLYTNDLRYADASRAFLAKADLSSADLTRADLTRADLRSATLKGTDFRWADLQAANLSKCDLTGADLRRVKLLEADLTEANLKRAKLTGSRLDQTKLAKANLESADLTYAKLTSADLTQANLTAAKLSHAELGGADLTGATLQGADLKGVDLSQTRGLTLESLSQALRDDATRLPAELRNSKAEQEKR